MSEILEETVPARQLLAEIERIDAWQFFQDRDLGDEDDAEPEVPEFCAPMQTAAEIRNSI